MKENENKEYILRVYGALQEKEFRFMDEQIRSVQ